MICLYLFNKTHLNTEPRNSPAFIPISILITHLSELPVIWQTQDCLGQKEDLAEDRAFPPGVVGGQCTGPRPEDAWRDQHLLAGGPALGPQHRAPRGSGELGWVTCAPVLHSSMARPLPSWLPKLSVTWTNRGTARRLESTHSGFWVLLLPLPALQNLSYLCLCFSGQISISNYAKELSLWKAS